MFIRKMNRCLTLHHLLLRSAMISFGMGILGIQLLAGPAVDRQEEKKPKRDTVSVNAQGEGTERGTQRDQSFTRLYNLGLIFLENGQADSAVVYLSEAHRIMNSHPKLLVNLGRAYIDTKEFEKALALVERVVSLDSLNADAYRVQGRIMHSMGNADRSVAAYQKSIELDSNNPYALNNLALIYVQQERFDDALSLLRKAIELKNDVPFFHNNLGIACEGVGDLQRAAEAFQTALSLDSNYEKAAINLERIELKKQKMIQETRGEKITNKAKE